MKPCNCLVKWGAMVAAFAGVVVGQMPDISWYTSNPTATRYEISTDNQLAGLAVLVNRVASAVNFQGKTIVLVEDIDLSVNYGVGYNGGKGWDPIGSSYNNVFMGIFDGNEKVVSGLYINDATLGNAGLFGYVSGSEIKNLGIVNVNIRGGSEVGGVTGAARQTRITNSYSTGTINGANYVGGVAGTIFSTYVNMCYFAGTINGTGDDIGGLVGTASDYRYASRIIDCYSAGEISSTGNRIGGVVGIIRSGEVTKCYSISKIAGVDYVGGIVGYVDYGGTAVTNCAALNPGLKGTGGNVGRVSGGGYNYGDYARLTGNIAFSGLTNNAGTTTWNNKGAAAIDGADLSAININIDGTIGGCFTTANGWAVQDGMLPGFGAPLELPDHLSLLVNAQVPTITTQPASAAVKTGTTRNLTVTASVTGGTLTYQWYTNTTAANTGGTAISGATSATYAAPIDAAGTFHYYVVITNTIGNNGDGGRKVISVASSVATLVVTAVVNAQIPTITKQPENATARVGTPHSFTVAASAADNGTLGYQWYSNTTASSAGGAAITGATGPVYTVSSGSTGTFYYYAVVTNTITNNGDGGNKTAAVASSAARLTVTSPVIAQTPAIIRQPASAVVKVGAAGATYSLTVAATAADGGVLSYQWYSNTTAGNVGGTAIYGAAAATYTASIHVIGTFHYYVVVTNTIADNGDGGQKTASVASSPATLTVSVDGIGVLSQERIIPGAGARDGAEAAAAAPPGILAGGITAGPNPAGRESGKAVNFYREGGLVKDGTLVVYDASGNFIKRIVIRDKAVVGSAKRAVASWDMRDSRSCPVGAGAYLVKGTVSALGGKKEKVAITVGIW